MISKALVEKRVGRDPDFRWHGEVSRVEGFSDAVFAFALTLLVVSLEVPRNFDDLLNTMRGFLAFGVCFAALAQVWYWHYQFFRRIGLQDTTTNVLNALLLFVVLFYVYPLKFLFSLVINSVLGVNPGAGAGAPVIRSEQLPLLMVIYGAGFLAVNAIFVLLYFYAYQRRAALGLNAREIRATRESIQQFMLTGSLAVLSILIAVIGGPDYTFWAGMVYWLIAPAQWAMAVLTRPRPAPAAPAAPVDAAPAPAEERERSVLEERYFRWRSAEPSRVEGFSDGVFAFAVTLLVVSLNVPQTFDALLANMQDFVGFGVCFVFLIQVWYWHYRFFRRTGLQTPAIIWLNALLLFVVLFYIYPLKFLFTLVTAGILGQDVPGNPIQPDQFPLLMAIYSSGFFAVNLIFAIFYYYAGRLRAALEWNPLESAILRENIELFLANGGVGLLSIGLALLLPGATAAWAGLVYFLLLPVRTVLGRRAAIRRRNNTPAAA